MGKILVINNDMDTMSLLQNWLEKKSYEVKFTSGVLEAMELIKNFAPGLILLDVLHKDAAVQIKNDHTAKNIPVILMTGHAPGYRPLTMNADDVIEKPFDLDLLEKKNEQLIR